jgi:dihydrolipoamide dehydrogenase
VIGDALFNGPRQLVWQNTQGRIQVYLDAITAKTLGAELLGHQAEHLAHLLAHAITHKMTAEQFLQMPIYHPRRVSQKVASENNTRKKSTK